MSDVSNDATGSRQPAIDHVSDQLASLRGEISSMTKSERKDRLQNSCDGLEERLRGYGHDDLIAAELKHIAAAMEYGFTAISEQLKNMRTILDSISQNATANGQNTSAILSHIDATLTASMDSIIGL